MSPVGDSRSEGGEQPGRRGAQFIAMGHGKPFEQLLAARRDEQKYLAAIPTAGGAPNPAVGFETAAQFDGAVMPDLQAFGQDTDGRFKSRGGAFDRKQCLMLLRLDSNGMRHSMTEA
jgi:hypothetical protein